MSYQPSIGLILQPRDHDLLAALATHRFLRSDHVHALLFAESSWRVTQRRLRLLWQHKLVDRLFVPAVLDGRHQPLIPPRQPVYTLSSKGATLVAERTGSTHDGDRTPQPFSLQTLEHQLVVSEFMVALVVAGRRRSDLRLEVSHEWALWHALSAKTRKREGVIVPDGAFTLSLPDGKSVTFCLEIVRAGTKGGNRRFAAKLAHYAELNRAGFFRDTYGFERVRAVLVLTTSSARAQSLRSAASTLRHSRGLFWFGSYLSPQQDGFAIAASSLFSNSWSTASGERVSLASALGRQHQPPCTNLSPHPGTIPASS